MIIGGGDIASVLKNRPDRLYFAAGVSNSQEDNEDEYRRERELLLAQDPTVHLVYFSSLSVFYAGTRYAEHKRQMEWLVKGRFAVTTIVRLGNIAWGTNPHTLINHFKAEKAAGHKLDIQPTTRYVVDLPEFRHWLDMIPAWDCEMNVPGRMMTVQEIVDEYV